MGVRQGVLALAYGDPPDFDAAKVSINRPTFSSLEVRDDGVGANVEAKGGRGLANMRQRAEDLGGSLTIESSGAGTVVRAVLPMEGL